MLAPIVVAAFTTQYSGMLGWQASFLLTLFMSIAALVIWYCFSVPHVIHDLNTPTAKHSDLVVDGQMVGESSGSGKMRKGGTGSGKHSRGGSGKHTSSSSKTKKSNNMTSNPMLLDQLL